MFIPNDGITEIVAHFIGYFQIRVEDARARTQFDPFYRTADQSPEHEDARPRKFNLNEQFATDDVIVDVRYQPPAHAIVPLTVTSSVTFDTINISIPYLQFAESAAVARNEAPAAPGGNVKPIPPLEDPGSTILIASQIKFLLDDDVLVVGDRAFEASARLAAHAELDALTASALHVSAALNDLADLRSVAQLVHLVEDGAAMVQSLSADDFIGFDSLYLQVGDRIDGRFSNGVAVATLPLLDEVLATRMRSQEDDGPDWLEAGEASYTVDASKLPAIMEVSSGGNLSFNEVSIVNVGQAPGSFIVAGDYHRLDAIYQTNVLRDFDTVDGNWPAQNLSMGGNGLYNNADFTNHDYEAKTGEPFKAGGGFPDTWTVSVVDGDMIFLDWIQQFNFTSDHDTQILTAMGTNSFISSGLNLGFNQLSFANLGIYFDLVVIGGSVYDGNFISQTNVLLDSDRLDVMGSSSATKGSTTTGENLLWNEAAIENVGSSSLTSGLKSHQQDAVTALAAGDKTMPSGFKSDSAADGLGNLKVLYVSGNVYDVHHVNQVNVVGDADNLAIYEASLLKAQDSVWKVTTGHNTLVNKAKIVDYDNVGKSAHVGGQIYSDAVLVQADLLEGLSDRLTTRGTEIANEVIAFLDDQTDFAARFDDHPVLKNMMDVGASHDIFQSVFA